MQSTNPILIIEGDHTIRELMTLSLSRLGRSIVTAQDSAAALEIARKESPVLIVLDLFLPRSNTIELLSALKEIPQTKHAKVIVITSLGYQEVIQKALTAGANDFLVKPFDADELLSRAKNLIYPA